MTSKSLLPWLVVMAGGCGLTLIAFALPWQNSVWGSRWAFSFPEGWIGAAVCAAGAAASSLTFLPWSKRRSMAALSVLCSVLMLGCTIAFAARTLRFSAAGTGSGPGVVLAAMADLAWTLGAVKCHVALGRTKTPSKRKTQIG